MSAPTRPTFGQTLLAEGLLGQARLDEIRASAARRGVRLGVAVVREGGVDESALVRALSRLHGCPAVDLGSKAIDRDTLALVPSEVCWKHPCLPLFVSRGSSRDVLFLGLEDPGDLEALDDVGFRTGLRIRPVMVGPVQLDDALRRHVGEPGPPAAIATFSEAPLLQMDTAPLVGAAEPQDVRAEPLPEEPEETTAEPPVAVREPTEPFPEPGDPNDRDARTRRILQALTRLLISKDLFTREELLAEVRALDAEEE